MSKIFRGIFISSLRNLYEQNQLIIPNDTDTKTDLSIRKNFDVLLNNLMEKPWVVYSKEPFAGPEKLLDYLGRYVNKIAISNNRILDYDEESVTFKWRDYSDNNKIKIMKLKPEEFISRFLRHVVPAGFMRIRFFGFLANACKKENIATIRKLLSYEPDTIDKQEQGKDVKSLMLKLTGIDVTLCSKCQKGHLHVIQVIPSELTTTKFDTS